MANGASGNELGRAQEWKQKGTGSYGLAEDYLSNAIGERSFATMSNSSNLSAGDAVMNTMSNNFGITPMTGESFLRNVAPNIAGKPQPQGKPIRVQRVFSWDGYCKKC